MSSTTITTTVLSDRVVAWLRTVVPGLWAALIAWALGQWPAAASTLDRIGVDLTSTAVQSVVVALVLAGWYAAARWAEPRLPAWLVRIVLGSVRTPTYAPATSGGAAAVTALPDTTSTPGV